MDWMVHNYTGQELENSFQGVTVNGVHKQENKHLNDIFQIAKNIRENTKQEKESGKVRKVLSNIRTEA